MGQEVLSSLTPGQQVIKIVHEEMIALMGSEEDSRIRYSDKPPTVIMLVGLQGAGKTTMGGQTRGNAEKAREKADASGL